ncbi:olfactory receptor 1496-like isoform X1 [Penaeus chinensis]|uniref:olfactory receptor 1496-like isoform X1 n=1 Tax=Penaeus chinensis TaxID=139456 RepID=UPI001FB5E5A3|nr:olfactory receptor 1496-like isoform X1 [Penaeus chinensis]
MNCPLAPALYMTLSLLTIIECVLTIFIYIMERRLRKRTTSPFVYSLAVSIALLSAISFIFNVKLLFDSCRNKRTIEWCVVLSIFLRYLHVVSCFCVTCLALYRYLYLCWPLHYPMLVTKRRCCYVTLACWTLPIALVAVPSAIDGQAPCADMRVTVSFYATYIALYISGALATFVAYFLVALEFRRKRHALALSSDVARSDRLVKGRTERSALSVLALYAVLSLPHIIMLLVTRMSNGRASAVNLDSASLLNRLHLLLFLPFYAWANKLFRTALITRARKMFCRKYNADSLRLRKEVARITTTALHKRKRKTVHCSISPDREHSSTPLPPHEKQ